MKTTFHSPSVPPHFNHHFILLFILYTRMIIPLPYTHTLRAANSVASQLASTLNINSSQVSNVQVYALYSLQGSLGEE